MNIKKLIPLKKKNIIIHTLLSIYLIQPCLGAEYKFAAIEGLVEQEIGKKIIEAIYQNAGLKISIHSLPGVRAETSVKTGHTDGEIMRIWSYGEENDAVIRIPTPYYYLETMAFFRRSSRISDIIPEEFKNFNLIKIKGVKHTDSITRDLFNVQEVYSTLNMMQVLNSRFHIDVALTNTIDGLVALKRLGLENDIQSNYFPFATLQLYHYLRKDHAKLVPVIDNVIKEMKNSGEMSRIIHVAETATINRLISSR